MRSDRLRAHVAAVRGDAVDVRRSLIRADEDDARVIGAPGRRKRLHMRAHVRHHGRADGAIPAVRQILARTALRREREEMDVLRRRADRLGDAVAGDRRAVGRPRRIAVRAELVGDASHRAAADRRHPDVDDDVALAVLGAVRDERDLARVRREARLGVVPIAVGQSPRLAARDVDDPHVPATSIEQETLVGLVAHAVVDADAVFVGILCRADPSL